MFWRVAASITITAAENTSHLELRGFWLLLGALRASGGRYTLEFSFKSYSLSGSEYCVITLISPLPFKRIFDGFIAPTLRPTFSNYLPTFTRHPNKYHNS